jgi:NADPH:quinone reductase-like Zn-dependent oxidoreductase
MKAARIHAYGHSDRVEIEDIAQPTQSSDDVLVRIRAAGINPVDWKIREGYLAKGAPRSFPFTLGQDFCGEVLAIGADVTDVECGDEVYGFANGAYAENAVVAPTMIASKPRTVDDATAAGLPTPGLTALQIVANHVDPRQGQTILIHGAAGGVGAIATQLCIAKGARVVATASSRDSSYLTSLGVARVIDYATERFEDEVSNVDAVIDLVGGETLARSLPVIRDGGVLVTSVGAIDDAETARRKIRGTRLVMQKKRLDLVELARLVDLGVIKPRRGRVLSLADAARAQDMIQAGQTTEKLVLSIS